MLVQKDYKFWFCTGSQDLYGDECLAHVAEHSQIIVKALNESGILPYEVVWKPTLITNEVIRRTFNEANTDENCAGVITWCHTFSPAKSWILGLKELRKPLLHLHTQFNREIPYDTIDMDFMNLNQAAHGDREFGYIVSRLGIPRKIVVGHYTDPEVAEKLALRLKFDAENGKGSYLKARSSEICEMLVKRFGLDLSKKKKRASVKKSDDAENEE